MNFKYMRVICFFDLPVLTLQNRREYTKFRKYLIKNGFMMLQESVYCKLVTNVNVADAVIENLSKNKPSEGLVQVLKITEKQFSNMEYIVGQKNQEIINDTERLIIL